MAQRFRLRLLPDDLAVCRLDAEASEMPTWAIGGGLWSILRHGSELSVVCETVRVPEGIRHEPGWRALTIDGRMDFSQIGVLANLTTHLATAGVSVFALSTYDTDVLLLQGDSLATASQALFAGGHEIVGRDGGQVADTPPGR